MLSTPLNIYSLKSLKTGNEFNRKNLKISPSSRYGDNSWDFSSFEDNPNVKPSSLVLRFDFKLKNGASILDSKYDNLRETFKELIYAAASSTTKKIPSPPTLKKIYTALRFLINWMTTNNLISFSQFSIESISEYILHVQKSDLHPMTKIKYLDGLKLVWEKRKKIRDPLKFDPLKGKSSATTLDISRDDFLNHRYDFIPDSICQDLIRRSISLIREKGPELTAALLMREKVSLAEVKRGKSRANRDRAKAKVLQDTNFNNYEVTKLSRELLTCCYIVIIFFTGIRASEMLTLRPEGIEQSDGVTLIHGRLIKITKKEKKWMAPKVVHEAFNLARLLTKPMRDAIDFELKHITKKSSIKMLEKLKDQLFLGWSQRRIHGYLFKKAPQVSNIKASIHTSLKEIVQLFNLTDEAGNLWKLHSHQFRKSFVRFMCANSMNVRYLQEHMGHKSLDMTMWYDTDDIELTQEIVAQLNEYKVQKLNPIFNQIQNFTGAGSHSFMSEIDSSYKGIISPKSKEVFIRGIAEHLTMRNTGHSWCLADSDNGNCTGVLGCMMDISMTQQCKSAVITEEHLPEWLNIKEKHEQSINSDQIGTPQKEALRIVLAQVIEPTIEALRKGSVRAHGSE